MENHNYLYLTSSEDVLFDPYYRYKISTIEIGNSIKKGRPVTVLVNMNSFCEELRFSPDLLIKIIGKMLSCKSGLDKSGNYSLQGNYEKENIKNVLYSFIQKYLLCVNCDTPEIILKHRHNKIKQKCNACGNNIYLENCKEEIVGLLKNV